VKGGFKRDTLQMLQSQVSAVVVYLLFLHPSFLYFFISPFLSLVLASAIRLLFLPFILLSSLPFLHKKNADKEFNDTAQFQCKPECENIQFDSTVVISSMCLK